MGISFYIRKNIKITLFKLSQQQKMKIYLFLFIGLLNFVLFENHGWANDFQEVSTAEVKYFLDNKNALLVNVLSQVEFRLQHIKGSINIPYRALKTSTLLPENKSRYIIFYCMGRL
jgi:hypothetical protein